ncbi:MAG: GWxTD domain-containing protein [Candidatus Latescibacteria bacterium]|nr:GWxTD domain-containing protein [Candidatus Latescibacterota bacterium]
MQIRIIIKFLDSIPDFDRADYDDISLVATKDELAEYEALEPSKRFSFLRRFWASREGALMLGADARRVEHYRRVWFARTFFGKVDLWDKRGEVYIRYGEPNYRSRSGYPNPLPPPAVLLFKQRKIATLMEMQASYRADEPARTVLPMMYTGNTYYPGGNYDGMDNPEIVPIEDAVNMNSYERIQMARDGGVFETDASALPTGWLWEVMGPGGTVHLNAPPGLQSGIEPAIPIDRDASGSTLMPWESWVYLGIGKDMEFVFTDRYMRGDWDFPLTPSNLWNSSLVVEVNNAQSGVELMQAASELPEFFDVPPGADLLEFYYDLASFQGENGQSELEVYFGIPPEQVELRRDGDRVQMEVERSLVLADVNGDSVYRVEDELVFRKSVEEVNLRGLFVELASLEIPPGEYTLGVKLADRISGKWGMYRQEVEIPSFQDVLAISDIEMAWDVSDSSLAAKKWANVRNAFITTALIEGKTLYER